MQALVTGISGEVGTGLIKKLRSQNFDVVAVDIKEPTSEIAKLLTKFYLCDVSDKTKINEVFENQNLDIVFHLASILSTGGEKNPELAAKVNIEGTLNLLEAATNQSLKTTPLRQGSDGQVRFIFPSSIAVYGLTNLKAKSQKSKVPENEFLNPITMYGISKLACENLGNYFSKNYKLLDTSFDRKNLIDFRSVRFPGLLSPDTVPSGGTSDYGPEMIHAAAKGLDYECFVRAETKIPFMAMADAADVLLNIANAPKNRLTQTVYNVHGFSVSASEIYEMTRKFFPNFRMTYKVNVERQRIVDSWPLDVDDSNAARDWGWQPKYSFEKTFSEYLIPKIKERY